MSLAAAPPLRVAVIGGARASEAECKAAERLGSELAAAGAVVICGGHGGVMEAVSKGANRAGGLTVGILPGSDAKAANPWITLPLPSGMGEARNALVVRTAEVVVAIGGEWGTLSEIALARKMNVSVVSLGVPPLEELDLETLDTPEEAAEWALERALEGRKADT